MIHDCIIVGGGIAGLQAAIQLGRYSEHKVLVIDSGEGRSNLCRSYHNILGFPDGISGEELRKRGVQHAKAYGISFIHDRISRAHKKEGVFTLTGDSGAMYESRTLLLATGLTDRHPELPGLKNTLGISVYVCPDCDGYEIKNKKTIIMGSGTAGANMARILSSRTPEMVYINHEQTEVPSEILQKLKDKKIEYINEPIEKVQEQEDGMISAVILNSGRVVEAERGFIAFGNNPVHSELAEQLGAEIADNKHVVADARSRMTSVENLWIAGDLGIHSEQAAVAMGDGVLSGIWINKALHKMKK
ncbi:NAD(P)/FAD-dependent oxidoreductase [Paenibacillus sp. Marseille-Q4541]|uniref:NAD(P)/FAD-dependent oxidoreductase n=1 Tax=Paenibacillus sp. Marseille-Q4541 TaxID=2831522 RepID=UPI001BA7499E|nr:NAD(P)/FAD-dependent oxidoreductase [Paenibacillus sp. Marseille-Q4541]